MPRMIVLFCFLATLFLASPLQAQEAQPMHMLEGKTVEQKTPPTLTSPPVGLPQSVTASPNSPQEHMIPFTHMGQPRQDQKIISAPSLPGMPSSTWGAMTIAPPEAPKPPTIEKPAALPEIPAHKTNFAELMQGNTAVAGQVIDPLHLRMRDGRVIQLAGIDVPDFDPNDPGPVSVSARDMLKALVESRQIRLFVTKDSRTGRMTRLGDMLAHVELPDKGIWVQGALLSAGLARVRPGQRNPEMAAQMMALEDQARAAKRGLWADPRYAVLTPETTARGENGFAIVEGQIFAVATNKDMLYLNFGPDWHTDFTIGITADMRRAMGRRNMDPQSLSGRHVRVRGWLREYNGPYLELENPVWLELIPEKTP
jgi:micrococcal nuclease